ncbi:protein of unknown function [Kytococcus aerolatus]|uniref:DUF222 domain-containing protein n=1 Tax=Kytococcus aerolatus TaxID=592308 RepID=A0A212TCT1_9MICO|nr:HNH endonuclease signature motif containing protein [Kytococcus aerolatus]SNC63833.1 protein of unknown function [Kytococcus aerolatus]
MTDAAGVGCGPWEALEEAFARANGAVDELMAAMAEAGRDGGAPGPRELEWLARSAAAFSARGDRVRQRSFGVLRAARESGRASHDDDSQYVARKTAGDGRRARRDQWLAEALGNDAPVLRGENGTERGGEAPGRATEGGPRPLATAMDRGLVREEQARVVLAAVEDLPESHDAAVRRRFEAELGEKAQQLTPRQLRVAARRLLEEYGVPRAEVERRHEGRVREREEQSLASAQFWMKDNGDGTWFGQFTLPELQAHMLDKVIGALASPRRRGTPGAGVEEVVDWRHERGRAFAELVDHLPADELGAKTNAVVMVMTDLETLRGETDRAGVTDSGAEVSAGQVRRLAASAGIIPVVMGGPSQPLDLGRQTRVFSTSQRAALVSRYDACAEEHCDRPLAWCEIHHEQPWVSTTWSDGRWSGPPGRTDLRNAIPLCGRHHRRLADRSYRHTVERDAHGRATVRFHLHREPARRDPAPQVLAPDAPTQREAARG